MYILTLSFKSPTRHAVLMSFSSLSPSSASAATEHAVRIRSPTSASAPARSDPHGREPGDHLSLQVRLLHGSHERRRHARFLRLCGRLSRLEQGVRPRGCPQPSAPWPAPRASQPFSRAGFGKKFFKKNLTSFPSTISLRNLSKNVRCFWLIT